MTLSPDRGQVSEARRAKAHTQHTIGVWIDVPAFDDELTAHVQWAVIGVQATLERASRLHSSAYRLA